MINYHFYSSRTNKIYSYLVFPVRFELKSQNFKSSILIP
nr:MAG TPA: hypothetical protein [Bacteriophage sp.]